MSRRRFKSDLSAFQHSRGRYSQLEAPLQTDPPAVVVPQPGRSASSGLLPTGRLATSDRLEAIRARVRARSADAMQAGQ